MSGLFWLPNQPILISPESCSNLTHICQILGCYAQPAEETANSTHIMTSEDPVKECRDVCQPLRNDIRSTNFAMFFWLSEDKSECYCLPDYPLGGNLT